jgi:hypothetical protein
MPVEIVTRQTGPTALNRGLTNQEGDQNFLNIKEAVDTMEVDIQQNAEKAATDALVMAIALG